MSTGALMPVARLQAINASGVMNGAKLFTYITGTSTKKNTWSDAGLSVLNSNPVVADSLGFFPAIYGTQGDVYSLTLSPSTDTDPPTNPVWTQDGVYLPLDVTPTTPTQPNSTCEGRLTLTTGVPITTTDVNSAVTVYFTPYKGNRIALYDGSSAWTTLAFAELSASLAGKTASTPYDIFAYNNSGTVALDSLVAWTNTTTRATALTLQDGIFVKTGATTRRYIGTVFINGSGGQTNDAQLKRYLYNYYNRVDRSLLVIDTTDNWVYSNATWRQARASTANQVEVMQGVAESSVRVTVTHIGGDTATGEVSASVGEDSTTTPSANWTKGGNKFTNVYGAIVATGSVIPAVGWHKYVWLEVGNGGGGTITFFGDDGGTSVQSGMAGTFTC